MKSAALSLLLLIASNTFADELAPFTSDGCSAFPDGTRNDRTLWIECCIRHDLAYWQGGAYAERLAADLKLESCVADLGQPDIAKLMLQGVRAGGNPLLPTPFRWGYGWPYPRDYRALNADERAQVRSRLEALRNLANSALDELAAQPQSSPVATD